MATRTKTKNLITKRQKPLRTKKFTKSQNTSHKTILSGVAALIAITIITISAVTIDRGRIAQSASEASAPSAIIDLSRLGSTVSDLLVKKGQNVIWQSQDGNAHQLALAPTSTKTVGFGENVIIDEAGSYNYVFDQIGTFYYYDILNPELIKGIITVKE